MNEKYLLKRLLVETTRKCNLSCVHCCNGDAQNITIARETIDRMLSQVEYCEMVSIIGGEPLLEIEALECLVDSIARHNVNVVTLSLITNGTIRDARLVGVFDKFLEGRAAHDVSFLISDDIFHDKEESEKTKKYYDELFANNEKVYVGLTSQANENDGYIRTVDYRGRGKELIDKHYRELKREGYGIRSSEGSERNVFICKHGRFIESVLSLSVKGDIGIGVNMSDYNHKDKLSIGNILEYPLEDIISRHNQTCLISCAESYNVDALDSAILDIEKAYDGSIEIETQYYEAIVLKNRIECIWELRAFASKCFQHVPNIEIMRNLPSVPDTETWVTELDGYMSARIDPTAYMPYYKEKYISATRDDIKKISTLRCIVEYIKSHKDTEIVPLGMYFLFPFTPQFAKLQNMEAQYANGKEREKIPDMVNTLFGVPDSLYELTSDEAQS